MSTSTTRRVRPANLRPGMYVAGRKVESIDTRADLDGKRAVVRRRITVEGGAAYDVPTDWVAVDREAPAPAVGLDASWADSPARESEPVNEVAGILHRNLTSEVARHVDTLSADLPGILGYLQAHALDADVLDLIVWAQNVRSTLKDIEDRVTDSAGRSAVFSKTGLLPDGRTYTIRRGKNRKTWQHDDWKHDVRAAVLEQRGVPGVLVNPGTGEEVNVFEVITAVQDVHGSTAPRLTSLRALGLEDDAYCESTPGSWGVEFAAPIPKTDPTTATPLEG